MAGGKGKGVVNNHQTQKLKNIVYSIVMVYAARTTKKRKETAIVVIFEGFLVCVAVCVGGLEHVSIFFFFNSSHALKSKKEDCG